MKKIELNPSEVKMLTNFMEEQVNEVHKKFDEIIEEAEKNGTTIEEVTEKIKTLDGWDGKAHSFKIKGFESFPDGFVKNVYDNLLNRFCSGIIKFKPIGIIAIKRAAENDKRIQNFVEAVSAGCKKFDSGFSIECAEAIDEKLLGKKTTQ